MSFNDLLDAITKEGGHTWNHRVVWIDGMFGISEVYYNRMGVIENWTRHMGPIGETVEELKEEVEMFLCAFKAPTLKQIGEDEFARLVEME